MQKTKKKRDACERDKKERPLVASYQFTRCLWVDPAAPFCARLDDLKVSLSPLRKSWRCCCFEWGHNATTFSFFFTRYFLFFFYLNVSKLNLILKCWWAGIQTNDQLWTVLAGIFKPLSTFLWPAPFINRSNINNFFLWIFVVMLGIKLGAAGWEANILPLCYAVPFIGNVTHKF